MPTNGSTTTSDWLQTACILCGLNCGLEVQTEGKRITRIRGDKNAPGSEGYLCQKASRIDHYQNSPDRLTSPLRRRPDGSFEEISWETAVSEIAAKLVEIRDTHGGTSLAYYGGGGQGNHLGGTWGAALRTAMRTPYLYTSLAQEKTGDFWVNGKLFGKQTCHIADDLHASDFVMFIGTNPWQSHGVPQARKFLRQLSKDPKRTMVVIDPMRTKTAELADVHLAVRPGTDAFLMSAMLGVLVQEDLCDMDFITKRTTGFDVLSKQLAAIPIDDYARRAGIKPEVLRQVTRDLAAAPSASIRTDLGIEQTLHTTLNAYLEKLLFLLTGNFGKRGGNNIHTQLIPLIGHSPDPEKTDGVPLTQVTGMFPISKIYPPNILPAEIDNDTEGRIRGVVVDSSNPMVTGADTRAYKRAFGKLELLVTIDVALSETARVSHYVLPASSQYEKWEATFFTMSFPTQQFHLRRPLFDPRPGTLPEPEIYRRLVLAMGESAATIPQLRAAEQFAASPAAAHVPESLHPVAGMIYASARRYANTYPEAVRRTGIEPSDGESLGDALFRAIVSSPSGTLISTHEYEDTFGLLRHSDGKIHLDVARMLAELNALAGEPDHRANGGPLAEKFPFVLCAGERREFNANTIVRDPAWRGRDPQGCLRMNPEDAERLGLTEGDAAVCESENGRVDVHVTVSDSTLPGVVALPHGYGLTHGENGEERRDGPLINLLTSAEHCDPLSKTPFHKHVPVRILAD